MYYGILGFEGGGATVLEEGVEKVSGDRLERSQSINSPSGLKQRQAGRALDLGQQALGKVDNIRMDVMIRAHPRATVSVQA